MSYATVAEFLRLLQVSQPTAAQSTAAQRCLDAASGEIDSYLSVGTASPGFSSAEMALLQTVNMDRGAEHWRLTPYGNVAQGPDVGPAFARLDPFDRHRASLTSLKESWGLG